MRLAQQLDDVQAEAASKDQAIDIITAELQDSKGQSPADLEVGSNLHLTSSLPVEVEVLPPGASWSCSQCAPADGLALCVHAQHCCGRGIDSTPQQV